MPGRLWPGRSRSAGRARAVAASPCPPGVGAKSGSRGWLAEVAAEEGCGVLVFMARNLGVAAGIGAKGLEWCAERVKQREGVGPWHQLVVPLHEATDRDADLARRSSEVVASDESEDSGPDPVLCDEKREADGGTERQAPEPHSRALRNELQALGSRRGRLSTPGSPARFAELYSATVGETSSPAVSAILRLLRNCSSSAVGGRDP